jgi:hypothetical protein
MKNKTIFSLSLIMALGITPTAFADGLTINTPTKQQVQSYWKEYSSNAITKEDYYGLSLTDGKNIYDNTPILKGNYNVGKLNQESIDDTLHVINTIRYATGLNPVVEDKNMSEDSQYSAFVNAMNNMYEHKPKVPNGLSADSEIYKKGYDASNRANLDATYDFIKHTEKYIKDDLGEDNLTKVGHRAWTLSPAINKVGIGAVDGSYIFPNGDAYDMNFQSMVVYDNKYNRQATEDAVLAYPSEVAISEFNSDTTPYSIFFGDNYDISHAIVKVTDLNSGEVFEYTPSNGLNINIDSYADMHSLVFGHDLPFQEGVRLKIEVFNVTKNGEDYPVNFISEFISLNSQMNNETPDNQEDDDKEKTDKEQPNQEETPSDEDKEEKDDDNGERIVEFRIEEKDEEEEIDYQSEVIEDNERYVGYKQFTPGQKGVKKVTYEYRLETNGDLISKKVIGEEVITQPIDEVTVIGTKEIPQNTKVDKIIIPFDITYEKTNDLYIGEQKVKQDGQVGEKEITYKFVVENNQLVEVIDKEVVTKDVVNKVILEGNKPVDTNQVTNNTYNDSKKEISNKNIKSEKLDKTIIEAENIIRQNIGTDTQRDRLKAAIENAKNTKNRENVTQEEIDKEERNIRNIINETLNKQNSYNVSNDKVKTGVASLTGVGAMLAVSSLAYINNKKQK